MKTARPEAKTASSSRQMQTKEKTDSTATSFSWHQKQPLTASTASHPAQPSES